MRKNWCESRIICGAGKVMVIFLLAAAVVTLFSGCATFRTSPSVDQVVEMSAQGVPAGTIIDKMKENDAVYWLDNEKLAELNNKGVSILVTDHMRKTRDEAQGRARERHQFWETQTWDPVSGSYLF